jgi:streptogramin lyase
VREERRRRPALEGLETRRLLSLSEFSVAQTENNPNAHPFAVTAGPNGNVWFVDQQTGKVGEVTPTGQITFPPNQPASYSQPSGITTGPDGNLWFTETAADKIGMINVTTGALTQFGTSAGMSVGAGPFGIAAGPDGNIWFTEASHTHGKIGMLDLATGKIHEYSLGLPADAFPYEITAGPDGNLWFTEQAADKIGRITTTGSITSFSRGMTGALPSGITAGSDGNIWFTDASDGKIGMINPATAVTAGARVFSLSIPGNANFSLPTITTGPDGNLWFTVAANTPGGTDQVAMIRPTDPSHTVTAFNTAAHAGPLGISSGPDGNVWFTETALPIPNTKSSGGGIGVVTLRSGGGPGGGGPGGGGPAVGSAAPAPTIVAEQIGQAYSKHNKKGKPIGKPVVEITLRFSTAMDPGPVENAGNYAVAWASTKKIKKKVQSALHPIAVLSVTADPSDTAVTLVTSAPRTKFARGGQVSIVSPGSFRSAAGASLDGPTHFLIGPGGASIT